MIKVKNQDCYGTFDRHNNVSFISDEIPTPLPTYTPTPTKDKPSVPNTQPVYTYNPSPKPGDYEYRSDPKTEKLIEEKVKSGILMDEKGQKEIQGNNCLSSHISLNIILKLTLF